MTGQRKRDKVKRLRLGIAHELGEEKAEKRSRSQGRQKIEDEQGVK